MAFMSRRTPSPLVTIRAWIGADTEKIVGAQAENGDILIRSCEGWVRVAQLRQDPLTRVASALRSARPGSNRTFGGKRDSCLSPQGPPR